jgi:hypothetical protein
VDWIEAEMLDVSHGWRDRRLLLFTEWDDTRRWLVERLKEGLLQRSRGCVDLSGRILVFTGQTTLEERDRIKIAFNAPFGKEPGRFGKQDFAYIPEKDAYRCPAGNLLPHHMATVENGLVLHRYWDRASCQACHLKLQCTNGRAVAPRGLIAISSALWTRPDRPKAMRAAVWISRPSWSNGGPRSAQ